MHPALTRYVAPPRRHQLRHLALGALIGSLSLIGALEAVTRL